MPTEQTSRRPIDRGWAWAVLVATTVQFFIFIGFLKSFGIFFVAYLQKYDATSSDISSVISIQTLVGTITSVFVLAFAIHFLSERKLVMFGAFLTAVSQVGNAFAPNVHVLMFTQGALFGMGIAISQLSVTLILTNYFDKRRGFANSFAHVGGSAGGLIWPVLLKKSLDYLGLKDTLLVIAGVFLQVVVCGALLRPLPPKKVPSPTFVSYDISEECEVTTKDESSKQTMTLLEKPKQVHTLPNFKTNGDQPHLKTGRRRTKSENCTNSIETPYLSRTASSMQDLQENVQKLYVSPSLQGLGFMPAIKGKETDDKEHHSKEEANSDNLNKWFNLALFKNPLFYIFAISSILISSTAALPINYIPPFARDFGVSDSDIASLVTVASACDLISRVCLVFIADSKTLKRHHILAVSMLLNGLACLFAPLYTSFPSLMVYSVLYGLFGQTYFSLFPVIIVDFLGLENLRHGLTTVTITMGISIGVSSVIIGELRDFTGSYLSSFYYMGVSAVVASIILLMEPLGRKMMKSEDADIIEKQNMLHVNMTEKL